MDIAICRATLLTNSQEFSTGRTPHHQTGNVASLNSRPPDNRCPLVQSLVHADLQNHPTWNRGTERYCSSLDAIRRGGRSRTRRSAPHSCRKDRGSPRGSNRSGFSHHDSSQTHGCCKQGRSRLQKTGPCEPASPIGETSVQKVNFTAMAAESLRSL